MSQRKRLSDPVIRNRPRSRAMQQPAIVEIPPPPHLTQQFINEHNAYLRVYTFGKSHIIVTRELNVWHMSISQSDHYPSWLDISHAWYRLIPNASSITGALILPPIKDYTNIHEFCMQVYEIPYQGT